MNIALIGPSGSGKGTHALSLSSRFKLRHIATGDLLRENLDQASPLGLRARQYIDAGELVPDEVVDEMIEARLRQTSPDHGHLFDGFPRTGTQAAFVDELFRQLGQRLDAVIYLQAADEEIIRRLSGRWICRLCQTPFHLDFHPFQNCPALRCRGEHLYQRPDDNPERVRARLRVFHRMTHSLTDYYQSSGRLSIVNGEDTPAKVEQSLIEAIQAVARQESRGATALEIGQVRALRSDALARAPDGPARSGLNLVLLGGPGSGKGTQAERLCEEFHLPHVATGDLFRDNLNQQTPLGQMAKTYMDRGELVPDDVTEAMVEERFAHPDTQSGFVLDGFPRSMPQAEALTDMLARAGRQLTGVLFIRVSDEEIVKRLSGRLICRACQTPFHLQFKPPGRPGQCDRCGGELYQRDDDNPKTVRNRLKTFHRQTGPLVEHYQQAGILVTIDGETELSRVAASTIAAARQIGGAA